MSGALPHATRVQVLLVEDDPISVVRARRLLADLIVPCQPHVVDDGDTALAFLRGEPPYEQAPPIQIVLLDLNLPRVQGIEVLEEMQRDAALRDTIVIVLTGDENPEALLRARGLQVAMCLTKSEQVEDLTAKLNAFEGFKLVLAQTSL